MIPVIWHDRSVGNWDMGIFQLTFEKHPDLFPQYNEKENPTFERAIVMCVGKPDVNKLRDYLVKIQSGVVIFASEEDAYFPWKEVMHDGLEAWTQYYSPSTKSEIKQENRILLGAPYRIKNYDTSPLPKKYLWSFIGQIQNQFRQRAFEVMETMKDGYLKIISGFGGYTPDGMEYQNYLNVLRQSQFVVAPAGSMNCDSFRLYESILCGAIPITDKRAPRDEEDFNYWDSVYPMHDIVTVNDWEELPEKLNQNYSLNQNDWWEDYKTNLELKLLKLAE